MWSPLRTRFAANSFSVDPARMLALSRRTAALGCGFTRLWWLSGCPIKNAFIIRQILKNGGRCEDMKFSLIYRYLPREGEEPGNVRQEMFTCFLKPDHDDIYQSPL